MTIIYAIQAYYRKLRPAKATAIRTYIVFAALCLIALVACGCHSVKTFPLLPAVSMTLQPDRASAVQIPDESFIFDTTVDSSYAKTLSPKQYLLPEYRLATVTRPPAADVDSILLIEKNLSANPSPYKSGTYPLVHRVILRTKDGKYFYTRPLNTRYGKSRVPEKYLSLNALTFSSPDGDFGSDGVLRTKPLSPMQVITSGYTVTIAVKGSNTTKTVVVPPSLTGLSSLDFSGYNGSYGADGSDGNSGCWGDSGADGRWSGLWRDKVIRGSDGGDGGHGTPGQNGQNGRAGGNGNDAGTIRVSVVPLSSKFFDKPLQVISITSTTGKARTVILPWGAQLAINARGGNGGGGGEGGDGGDGSNGANGLSGYAGHRGKPGAHATRSSRGVKGGRGGRGGPGMPGTDGGDGGDGGRGGSGANAGNGGNGGDGGNGGKGAEVILTIQGTTQFAEMVKSSLVFDVRGGDRGRGGDAGEGGIGGRAGTGGDAGDSGTGGSGGPGGSGGRGGHGGKGLTWHEQVEQYDPATKKKYYRTVARSNASGSRGDRGHDGRRGRPGNDGQPGRTGQGGTAGVNGQNGGLGNNGASGAAGSGKYIVPGPVKNEK